MMCDSFVLELPETDLSYNLVAAIFLCKAGSRTLWRYKVSPFPTYVVSLFTPHLGTICRQALLHTHTHPWQSLLSGKVMTLIWVCVRVFFSQKHGRSRWESRGLWGPSMASRYIWNGTSWNAVSSAPLYCEGRLAPDLPALPGESAVTLASRPHLITVLERGEENS